MGAVGRHGQAAGLVVIARLSGMPELVDRTKKLCRLAAVLLQLHSVFSASFQFVEAERLNWVSAHLVHTY